MVACRGVVLVDETHEVGRVEPVSGKEHDRPRVTGLDGTPRVLEHVDGGGPARPRIHQPTHGQPEAEGEVDRPVRCEREGGDSEPVDVFRLDACVRQCRAGGTDQEAGGGRIRVRVTTVLGLGRADDPRVHGRILKQPLQPWNHNERSTGP
jgi:hypothetical protein